MMVTRCTMAGREMDGQGQCPRATARVWQPDRGWMRLTDLQHALAENQDPAGRWPGNNCGGAPDDSSPDKFARKPFRDLRNVRRVLVGGEWRNLLPAAASCDSTRQEERRADEAPPFLVSVRLV